MPNEEPLLVTLAQMASQLRLPAQELRREVDEGRLPAVRVGRKRLLFDPERVLAILRERAKSEAAAEEGAS